MPQSSADRLLSRITALHKSLQLDEGGQLSTMERDLMLGYLRELYEIYAETTPAPPPTFSRSTPSLSPVAPTPPPAPPVTPPPPPPLTPPPAPVAPPPPAPVAPPAPERDLPVAPPAPEPAPFVAPPPPPPPMPAYTAPPAPEPEHTSASREINALFIDEGSASPFGRQALPDLTRGLTINNRVLFARDLFNQDTDLLNTTLRTLNSSGSFAAARPVLESLARRFDWVDEGKRETAGEFIELVRRRYA